MHERINLTCDYCGELRSVKVPAGDTEMFKKLAGITGYHGSCCSGNAPEDLFFPDYPVTDDDK